MIHLTYEKDWVSDRMGSRLNKQLQWMLDLGALTAIQSGRALPKLQTWCLFCHAVFQGDIADLVFGFSPLLQVAQLVIVQLEWYSQTQAETLSSIQGGRDTTVVIAMVFFCRLNGYMYLLRNWGLFVFLPIRLCRLHRSVIQYNIEITEQGCTVKRKSRL